MFTITKSKVVDLTMEVFLLSKRDLINNISVLKFTVPTKLKKSIQSNDLDNIRTFRIGSNTQNSRKPYPVEIVCAANEKA